MAPGSVAHEIWPMRRLSSQRALGGAATEYSTITNMIVAEELAKGDLGIAVAILSPISVANVLLSAIKEAL